jgi:mannose-1-phosphate guanylyltransferase/mannose-6-phosphate isomerase
MEREASMRTVILAGGGGTRLWPLSRKNFPKQFLSFEGKGSLLQKTTARFLPHSKTLLVSTNTQYQPLVQQQLAAIDPGHKAQIVVEPCSKNTAGAILLAVRFLLEREGASMEDPVLILPSDHLIEPESVFLQCIQSSLEVAKKGYLLLFGIRPTKPETGFGYIQLGQPLDRHVHTVLSFVEKPDALRALHFLESKQFYWNAGIFAFTPKTFLEELSLHSPGLKEAAQLSYEQLLKIYPDLPSISIDYALMEKSKRIGVCPLPVEWSDVGSWDSVYEVMPKDAEQNVKQGEVLAIDTKNSLILGGKKLICTIGLEDLLIVETPTALFISKKGESQKVKELVQELAQRGKDQLL